MNIGLVTLGCSKNQVDSEMILGLFKNYDMHIVSNPDEADIIIVNTCGFIESAKKEAIDTILEMADYKKGKCKSLIVTGCLAKRYKQEILATMPEVDLCIGVDEYDNIDKILSEYLHRKFLNLKLDFNNRLISSKYPLAYIKISEGCDNRCSYCAIPMIRGHFRSRKMEDILGEVKLLAKQGIQEFCIISQDTSKYGLDIYGELKLKDLIHQMSEIDGVKWIRILYMYLFETTDDLIAEMGNNEKVCNYFDIPIQHASNHMLKQMNRYDTKEVIYQRVTKIREMIPDAILRTTVMVGFPGETQKDYEELRQAVIDLKFDRLGAFTYSQEEGTKSATLKDQIKEEIKDERLKDILALQKHISLEANRKRLNKEYEVVVEDISEDERYYIARSYAEAPDVDGRILIKIDQNSVNKIIVGGFAKVKIIQCDEYDLYGKVV